MVIKYLSFKYSLKTDAFNRYDGRWNAVRKTKLTKHMIKVKVFQKNDIHPLRTTFNSRLVVKQ